MRVLLVEDEVNLARGLVFNLEREGIETQHVTSGEQALTVFPQYDLMILDLSLPGIDGLEVLRTVRQVDERYPVIVLTARAAEDDRIQGLSLGADDYVTKPFSLKELLLRVQAKLKQSRWYRPADRSSQFVLGLATFDEDRQTAEREGVVHQVTLRELVLARYLHDHPGRVLARDELLREVWGYGEGTSSRTPDTFMARIRKLIEADSSAPEFVTSVRGRGYMLVDGKASPE